MVTYEQWMRSRGREETTIETRMVFLKHLDHDGASPLTLGQCRALVRRWGRHAPKTVENAVSSIRTYLRFLRMRGVSCPAPEDIPFPKVPSFVTKVPKASAVQAAISGVWGRPRVVTELLYGSGLRISEVCGLRLKDVDMKAGLVKVALKKRERLVPMTRPAMRELKAWMTRRGTDPDAWLFPLDNNQRSNRHILGKEVKRHTNLTAHIYRHACALHLLEAGCPLHMIRELLGHAKIETTTVYLQADISYLLEVHSRYHPHGDGTGEAGAGVPRDRQW